MWIGILSFAGIPLLSGQEVLQDREENRVEIRILWYNLENMFHPSLEPLDSAGRKYMEYQERIRADREFSPGGVRHWTTARYHEKLTRIARIIVASGAWNPPELVGLCEVENGQVLEDLVGHPILKPWNYSYLHRDGPDHRGMDVALLFRDESADLGQWNWIKAPPDPDFDRTRLLLHAEFQWAGGLRMDLLLAHFISRYGGSARTAEYRRKQSLRLRALTDSLQASNPDHLLVVAGDFNEEPGGWSTRPLQTNPGMKGALASPEPVSGHSYKYQGRWSNIDRFLVSDIQGRFGISCRILALPPMLIQDDAHGGVRPFRTYYGYKYEGGYSDHLPLVLELRPYALEGER